MRIELAERELLTRPLVGQNPAFLEEIPNPEPYANLPLVLLAPRIIPKGSQPS